MKEEALKLADEWEKQLTNEYDCDDWIKQSAEMIRKLVAELEIKELVIDRLVDSQDNARACLSVDVEDIERLYR